MDKPRYRYSHNTQKWDALFTIKAPDLLDQLPPLITHHPKGGLVVNGKWTHENRHIRKLEQDCLQYMREHPIPYRSVLDSVSKPKRIDITYH